ncbi:hypothetical protein [Mucilaginibacter antarcticus]|uniref:Uncharacterized protein n=1 Tax=Mucilaginibacter antarcticus TaxID=1855725 RepID=A0ABW5XKW8_9SPHI
MKVITIPGDPHSVNSLMVTKTDLEDFHDHDYVRIESADGNHSVEKKIFRVVDAGENNWELQFE